MAAATLTKFIKFTGGYTESFPVAASAVIKRGHFLTLTAGAVDQAIALPGTDSTASSTSGGSVEICGIAEEDFTADAAGVSTDGQERSTILVRVVDDSFRVAMRIYNATPGSAEPRDLTMDGTTYEFHHYRAVGAGSSFYMLGTTTTGEFVPQARSEESAAADDYGIVWCKVTPGNQQLSG